MLDYTQKDNEELDLRELGELIGKHRLYEVPRLQGLYNLYKGHHIINDRVMSDANKPNNKIINDFYGKIVDTIVGYFLGTPVVINTDEDITQTELDYILLDNNIDDTIMEVGKECSIKGRSNMMVYQNDDGETKIVRLPAEEVVYIKDSAGGIAKAIRVYQVRGIDDNFLFAEVYDKEKVIYYKEVGDSNLSNDGFIYNWKFDNDRPMNPVPHIYGRVPIIPVVNNEEELGDYEKVITLVDAYDKLMSDASNEHEAYRNAYLLLKNIVTDVTEVEKFKETGVFEVDGDGDVKFVTKDIQSGAIDSHLERLRGNIFDFANVPPLSDENFAGNLSGIAIRFKLFGLENKCITKERKMNKAIRELLKVLNVVVKLNTGKEINMQDLTLTFSRNVPANLTEIVDTVSKLNGVVDTETLLGLLPFVDKPTLIMEKLEWEKDVYPEFTQDKDSDNKVNELLEDGRDE